MERVKVCPSRTAERFLSLQSTLDRHSPQRFPGCALVCITLRHAVIRSKCAGQSTLLHDLEKTLGMAHSDALRRPDTRRRLRVRVREHDAVRACEVMDNHAGERSTRDVVLRNLERWVHHRSSRRLRRRALGNHRHDGMERWSR